MNKIAFLLALTLAVLACNVSTPATPAATSQPPTAVPLATEAATATPLEPTAIPEEPTPEPTATPFPGTAFTFGNVSLVIPPGLASGIDGAQIPGTEDNDQVPEWAVSPEHIQLYLNGYALGEEKFHHPQIFVYRAAEYTAINVTVAANIPRLQTLFADPALPLTGDTLPTIPSFNAAQVFSAAATRISFQNGQGVRFLTEYAQYFAYANNYDLFYHFQGLTNDGEYYIIAILPITASVLPPDANPQSEVPPGGIEQPAYEDPPDWEAYYAEITTLLDSLASGDFAPTLDQLDALIASIHIEP